MKIKTIRAGSCTVGLVAAFVTSFLLAGAGSAWTYIASGALVSFLGGYGAAALVMRKFVIWKLKPMYQIMLSKNLKTGELEGEHAGKPNLVSGIEQDVRDWAETNRREISRLKENEKYRKEYIGNVSHEIKTPIFNIQGYISTLLDGGLDDPQINRKYLERAEKSIDRLINIVTDLDQISKLESGVLELKPERFDIVALTRECVESLEMDASRKNIRMKIRVKNGSASSQMFVVADKHHITQVFINLLVNSIRYGKQDGMTTITFIDLFDKIMVEVSDTGVGIAKEDIPRVFERFYRTDKSRSREEGGTGLGLSIVKHIMEAHNETITLRSEPGEGSTFTFTLTKK